MTYILVFLGATMFYFIGFAHGQYMWFKDGVDTGFQVRQDAMYEMFDAIMEEAKK